MPPCLFRYRYP